MQKIRVTQHPKQLNKIKEYKDVDIATLKTKSLTELSTIYQGKDADLQDCLISEAKVLFLSYKDIQSCKLDNHITNYEDAINSFLNFNHAFFVKYTHEENPNEKESAFSFIGSSQVHLTKLQSQYNQLIYRKQKRNNIGAKIVAYIALSITFVFSVLAFLDIKYPIEKTVPIQNECQCDFTKHLNNKSKQQKDTTFNQIKDDKQ